MKTKLFELGWVGLGLGLAHVVTACSSDAPGAASQAGAGGAPSAGTGSRFGAAGGKLSSAGMAGAGGVAQASMCRKTSDIDAPDGEFADANCDGIDGDKAKAIFVSPKGMDTASGAFGVPVKTITKGVALAIVAKKDVYVCQGDYAENLVIEGSVSLKVYGGYVCADWKRSNQRPVVNPVSGVPLRVKDVSGEVLFDRMHFKAADAAEPSGSSIAVRASGSQRATFVQSRIEAGRGQAGMAGVVPSLDPGKQGPGSNGGIPYDGSCTPSLCPGGAFGLLTCPSGFGQSTVLGGAGGDGHSCSGDTFCFCAGFSDSGTGQQGWPKSTSTLPGGIDGRPGLAGKTGPNGAAAVTSIGDVNADLGYIPSNSGSKGGFGLPGQAGEGGDGAQGTLVGCGWIAGPGGGQGGPGGCGGEGGEGGGAGGASLGLLTIESEVSLEFCEVISKDGGAGGPGGAGGVGEKGGDGGLPGGPTAGKGGGGGQGGPGGSGGPGGGGPSIGIFALGIAPILTQVSFTSGIGGKGAHALPGTGSGDAASGISVDYWPVDIRSVANGAAGAAGKGGI